ncbi:MAG: hypothetical protein ACKOAH_17365, partial [Pirellula sp.]
MKRTFQTIALIFMLGIASVCAEDGANVQSKAIPKTRSETKKVLGELKERTPRLPVPETVPGGTNPASSNVINGRARR